MYCKNCGKNNADGAQFCAGCGAPLQPRQNGGAPAPGKKHRALPWIIVGAAVLVAVAVILIVTLGGGSDGKNGTSGNQKIEVSYSEDLQKMMEKNPELKTLIDETVNAVAYKDIERKLDLAIPEVKKAMEEKREDVLEEQRKEAKKNKAKPVSAEVVMAEPPIWNVVEHYEGDLKGLLGRKVDLEAGIQVRFELETVTNGKKETKQHAFLLVKMDGKWYYAI